MNEIYNNWLNTNISIMRQNLSVLNAKTKWFMSENRKIISNKTDQTMFSHVLNTLTVCNMLIETLELKENNLISENDEIILYEIALLHDQLHKRYDNLEIEKQEGDHNFTKDEFIQLLEKNRIQRKGDELNRMMGIIQMHHSKRHNPTIIAQDPLKFRLTQDILYHLLLISDGIASIVSVRDAYTVLMKGLKRINNECTSIKNFNQIPINFNYHYIFESDGDMSLVLHHITQNACSSFSEPVLFFNDGTLYFSKNPIQIPDNIYSTITDQFVDYINDDVIDIQIEQNHIRISTKEFQKNFTMGEMWNIFEKRLIKIISSNLLEKKFLKLSKNEECIRQFEQVGIDEKSYIIYFVIEFVSIMIREYSLIKNKNNVDEVLFKIFECQDEVTKQNYNLLDQIRDTQGTRNGMKPFYYIFGIAKTLQNRIDPKAFDSYEEVYNKILSLTKEYLSKNFIQWEKKIIGNESLLPKINKMIKTTLNFSDRTSSQIYPLDFCLSEYSSILKKSNNKSHNFCFLCLNSSDLMDVNPATVDMNLQIQSDRVLNGVPINSDIKKICFSCYMRCVVRRIQYSQFKPETTFYIVVKPDYLYGRNQSKLISSLFANFYSLSQKDLSEWKKLEGDENLSFLTKKIRINPNSVSNLIRGLIQKSEENKKNIYENIFEYIESIKPTWIETKKKSQKIDNDDNDDNDGDEYDNDVDFGFVKSELEKEYLNKFDIIFTEKRVNSNGLVIPIDFSVIGEDALKKENNTSKWYQLVLLGCIIHYTTGSRIIITQNYNNINLLNDDAMIVLDEPPSQIIRLFGTNLELAGNDLHNKFVIGSKLWYLNNAYHGFQNVRNNTISTIIDQYFSKSAKLIDICYRSIAKKSEKSSFKLNSLNNLIRSLIL